MFPFYTANQGVFHAVQGLRSATQADMYIDGTPNTQAVGGVTWDGNVVFGTDGATKFFQGNLCQVGLWNSDKSANNSAMNTLQHSNWGF